MSYPLILMKIVEHSISTGNVRIESDPSILEIDGSPHEVMRSGAINSSPNDFSGQLIKKEQS